MFDMVRTDQPGYTDYRLHDLYVYRLNGVVDAYIDSVSLASKPTTNDPDAHLQRKRPAYSRQALIDNVRVYVLTNGSYRVIIKPLECGHGFPLFELANVNKKSPTDTTVMFSTTTVSSINSSPRSSTAASVSSTTSSESSTVSSMNSESIPSPTVSTQSQFKTMDGLFSAARVLAASPPVTGLFDVTFNGKEKKGNATVVNDYLNHFND
ncbi:uncharacterized protein LOC132726416 [Ruditapes philippinarum]|uniref:uncharacterized protein LOC132726416 n=1 Tax=Ruditapes philippinarum TaxID=129788 RepID=UPI00295C19C0|nr:uncharacterized protein LOC132726416 [Ruditapes philippinarum]